MSSWYLYTGSLQIKRYVSTSIADNHESNFAPCSVKVGRKLTMCRTSVIAFKMDTLPFLQYQINLDKHLQSLSGTSYSKKAAPNILLNAEKTPQRIRGSEKSLKVEDHNKPEFAGDIASITTKHSACD